MSESSLCIMAELDAGEIKYSPVTSKLLWAFFSVIFLEIHIEQRVAYDMINYGEIICRVMIR